MNPGHTYPTKWSRLYEAALRLADVDSEDDRAFHSARSAFRLAVNAYSDRRMRLVILMCPGVVTSIRRARVPKPDPRQVDMFGGNT